MVMLSTPDNRHNQIVWSTAKNKKQTNKKEANIALGIIPFILFKLDRSGNKT